MTTMYNSRHAIHEKLVYLKPKIFTIKSYVVFSNGRMTANIAATALVNSNDDRVDYKRVRPKRKRKRGNIFGVKSFKHIHFVKI